MQKHKYNIFPDASKEDFDLLVGDIRKNGYDLDFPIIIYQGAILDGWNRWRACQQVGEKPATKEFTGSDLDAINYTLRTNKRRNLTSSQWATIAVDAEEIMTEIAEEVERERRAKISGSRKIETGKFVSQSQSTIPTRTAEKAAEMFNTNKQYIQDAKRLKATKPEAFKAVQSGEKTITQVKREEKENKRESRRQENAVKIAAVKSPKEIVKNDIGFSTIVIDPPWDWSDEGDNNQLGRAKPDYSTMSLHELMILPINKLSDVDCHLYLWITNRSLPKGFGLLRNWGFRYITALTWVKPYYGLGNYFRGQTEHILFGVKGSQPLKRKDVGTVFMANRGEAGHSSKPQEFYSLVESCSPGPYLEMFSRSDREGWVMWGENE